MSLTVRDTDSDSENAEREERTSSRTKRGRKNDPGPRKIVEGSRHPIVDRTILKTGSDEVTAANVDIGSVDSDAKVRTTSLTVKEMRISVEGVETKKRGKGPIGGEYPLIGNSQDANSGDSDPKHESISNQNAKNNEMNLESARDDSNLNDARRMTEVDGENDRVDGQKRENSGEKQFGSDTRENRSARSRIYQSRAKSIVSTDRNDATGGRSLKVRFEDASEERAESMRGRGCAEATIEMSGSRGAKRIRESIADMRVKPEGGRYGTCANHVGTTERKPKGASRANANVKGIRKGNDQLGSSANESDKENLNPGGSRCRPTQRELLRYLELVASEPSSVLETRERKKYGLRTRTNKGSNRENGGSTTGTSNQRAESGRATRSANQEAKHANERRDERSEQRVEDLESQDHRRGGNTACHLSSRVIAMSRVNIGGESTECATPTAKMNVTGEERKLADEEREELARYRDLSGCLGRAKERREQLAKLRAVNRELEAQLDEEEPAAGPTQTEIRAAIEKHAKLSKATRYECEDVVKDAKGETIAHFNAGISVTEVDRGNHARKEMIRVTFVAYDGKVRHKATHCRRREIGSSPPVRGGTAEARGERTK